MITMTKKFTREDLLFSLCGLNCSLCPLFVRKQCSGCIEGSMCYKTCNIAPCSIEHGGVDYCFECGEYPCRKYDEVDKHDSLITHINQLNDIKKAQRIGIEKYNQKQAQKVKILNNFLKNYNPGNDKDVFFCTAVNLLPLDELEFITENLEDNTEDMTLKDKYEYLKEKLFERAEENKIKIELRKGKYNPKGIIFN